MSNLIGIDGWFYIRLIDLSAFRCTIGYKNILDKALGIFILILLISSPIQTLLSVLESHQISLRSRTSSKLVTAGWDFHPTPKKYLIHDLILTLMKTVVNDKK